MPANRIRPCLSQIAFVGTALPRHCGIATYTADLAGSVAARFGRIRPLQVAITDTDEGYSYNESVAFEIDEAHRASYRTAGEFLNLSAVDVACIQHEFGIFGGWAGAYVIDLARQLRMPLVTTFHTVLKNPDAHQRAAITELISLSDRLVAISSQAARLLQEVYQASPAVIDLIPHGIPDMPFMDTSFHKDKFGVEGHHVMLTFGLLGPNKGIEHVIKAMPGILAEHPDVVYLILGATHPVLLRKEGEAYRHRLQELASDLGVADHVRFVNKFVSAGELIEYLGAADIYLTPYIGLSQISSGTLAYAVGAGKAVVSTPYWYAEELLADDRGLFTPVGDSHAIAQAVNYLLNNPVERDAMRKRAYLHARQMSWSNVARLYVRTFERARRQRSRRPRAVTGLARHVRGSRELPQLKLDHLRIMTDSTGMLQHAIKNIPDFNHGYCVDDNARALLLMARLQDDERLAAHTNRLSIRYMAFVNYAFNPERGRFRNFLGFAPRQWLEDVGSEDSHGRTLWALGTVARRWKHAEPADWAANLFRQAMPAARHFTSPRGWAFALLGFNEYLARFTGDRAARDLQQTLAHRLMDLYDHVATRGWPWFEDRLTYSNARLCEALIVTGHACDDQAMFTKGLHSLEWLADVQTSEQGHFVPIGNHGFYHRGGRRARFDQQPIEALSMVDASSEAHRCTNDAAWLSEARRAFDWFLGGNDLRLPVCDVRTGACHDGLQPDHLNHNQGAESTLAFLLSLVHMRSMALEPRRRSDAEVVPVAAA